MTASSEIGRCYPDQEPIIKPPRISSKLSTRNLARRSGWIWKTSQGLGVDQKSLIHRQFRAIRPFSGTKKTWKDSSSNSNQILLDSPVSETTELVLAITTSARLPTSSIEMLQVSFNGRNLKVQSLPRWKRLKMLAKCSRDLENMRSLVPFLRVRNHHRAHLSQASRGLPRLQALLLRFHRRDPILLLEEVSSGHKVSLTRVP